MAALLLRFTAVIAALSAGLACWCACPGRLDWALGRALLREQERSAALERRDERARRSNEAKTAVVAEVVAGRLTLAAAAEQFQELQGLMRDDDADAVLGPWRKADDERGLYLCALSWAANALRQDPARSAAVLPRLEEEYRQRFGAVPWDEELSPSPAPPEPAGP